MRRVLCSLVLIATFVATAVSPAFARKEVKPKLKALQHAAYHFVGMIDRDDTGTVVGGGFCSATAVGPHTLMLAEHCNDPYTAEVYVDATMDQVRHNDPKLRTYSAEKYFDHQDHMLLDLAQITFADYAPVQLPVAQPYQGEHFYFTGSPNGQPNQYREGYVTGKLDFDQATDDPDIDAVFQEVGGEAVPQRVRPDPLGDVGRLRRLDDDPMELPGADRLEGVLSRSRASRSVGSMACGTARPCRPRRPGPGPG